MDLVEAKKQSAKARWIASLLLVGITILYLIALYLEAKHWVFPWLKSFAEAGLIGGLADWFAVTALFRYPLGIPIPHTAILPKKKDKI